MILKKRYVHESQSKKDTKRGFQEPSEIPATHKWPQDNTKGHSLKVISLPWFSKGLAKSKITGSETCFQVSRVQNWKRSTM